jgi:16S rRNA (guanine527-N7)-methyltransferase
MGFGDTGTPEFALDVSRETLARLETFLDALKRWSASTALVSSGDQQHLIRRHLADSLRLVPLLDGASAIADLGSGAGFPGLVLSIVTGRPIRLIEANKRKAAFLREAIRLTSAPASLAACRIEELTERFDLITARAVAPLERLLPLLAPHLADGGRALLPKGPEAPAEIMAASRYWTFDLRTHHAGRDERWPILEMSDIQRKRA